jgi:enterochelin esterase-like enzyme
MPKPMRLIVYLPPCYARRTDLRYPVLYLFHGQTYDENQWVRLGAPATADQLVSSGEVLPFLIVMPFDPYPQQPYEYGFDEGFLQDLLPYVDSYYRTLADRFHRAVGGLSRGSSWALHFGLSRPDLFGKIGMHSPIIFASDGLLVEKWLDIIPPDRMPQIYLDISENDQDINNARWLEDIFTVRAIPHEWHLNTGFHTEEYWTAHVEEYLRWYATGW